MATIMVPRVVWALGDAEQSTASGVTVVVRPLYYLVNGKHMRIGSINPDYAEPLMKQLSKVK